MHKSGVAPQLRPTPVSLLELDEPPERRRWRAEPELMLVWRFGLSAAVFAGAYVLRTLFVLC